MSTNSASYLEDMLNMDDDPMEESELMEIAEFSNSETTMSSANYLEEMIGMDEEPTETSTPSEVSEFFKGKNVFLTGGSGYVGCLLIEKLLRDCSEMGKLYLLTRTKKGKTSGERFKKLFSNVMYDRVKKEQPNCMDHIVMIEGDTSQPDLGLSPENRQLLIDNVHVVIHSAATTRFNETLKVATKINVRGIKLVVDLAKEMKNLESFVHISTAFVNCHLKHLDETFYKPHLDVDRILSLVELLDDETLINLTPKLIQDWVNTYAFTKALGEEVVRRYSADLPICIVRPSIMLQTHRDPIRGWGNTVVGLAGIIAGMIVCLLHTILVELSNVTDVVPADYVINEILVAAWDISKTTKLKRSIETASLPSYDVAIKDTEPPIYNCISSVQQPLTWGELLSKSFLYGEEMPSMKIVSYYFVFPSKIFWLFTVYEVLFHFIPALIIDGILRLTGRKPMLFNIYKKIHEGFLFFSYFTLNQWTFDNKNTMKLMERTSSVDRKRFDFDFRGLDWDEYLFFQLRGVRTYIVKDPSETIPAGRKRYYRIKVIFWTIMAVVAILFIRLFI